METATNGTTSGATVEPENCPTGQAMPINRLPPVGCMVIRREIVWCGCGVLIGGLLMYWLVTAINKR